MNTWAFDAAIKSSKDPIASNEVPLEDSGGNVSLIEEFPTQIHVRVDGGTLQVF